MEFQDQRRSERRFRLGFGALILAILVATTAAFAVAARRWWLPPLASVQGRAVDQVIYTLFAVSIPFFVAAQFFIDDYSLPDAPEDYVPRSAAAAPAEAGAAAGE